MYAHSVTAASTVVALAEAVQAKAWTVLELQGRLTSLKIKSGPYTKFQDRAFCVRFGVHMSESCSARAPCMHETLRAVSRTLFLGILTDLSVCRRHHKPPLRGGCASGRRGRVAGSAAPDRAKKVKNKCADKIYSIKPQNPIN